MKDSKNNPPKNNDIVVYCVQMVKEICLFNYEKKGNLIDFFKGMEPKDLFKFILPPLETKKYDTQVLGHTLVWLCLIRLAEGKELKPGEDITIEETDDFCEKTTKARVNLLLMAAQALGHLKTEIPSFDGFFTLKELYPKDFQVGLSREMQLVLTLIEFQSKLSENRSLKRRYEKILNNFKSSSSFEISPQLKSFIKEVLGEKK